MSTITTRTAKGSELTWAELDANFTALNTDKLQPDASGNVGIGTSSPTQKLHVVGDIQQNNANYLRGALAAGTTTRLFGLNAADSLYIGTIDANHTGGTLFVKNGTEQMRLDSSGNLGIGTSSPVNALGFGQAKSATGISFQSSDTTFHSGKAAVIKAAVTGSGVGSLVFETYEGGSGGGERMRLDSSGNLGIGTSSPGAKLDVNGLITISALRASGGIAAVSGVSSYLIGNTASAGGFRLAAGLNVTFDGTNWRTGTDGGSNGGAAILSAYGSGNLEFHTVANNGTTGQTISNASMVAKMTLDSSGNLGLGTTSQVNSSFLGLVFDGATKNGIVAKLTANTSAAGFALFVDNSGNVCGSISRVTTTSAVTYNTTSDYRLKTVIASVSNSGERLDALNPVEYEWKADGTRTRGFLAHEFQTVYAQSVSGEKDAVDSDGNPKYQSMQAGSAEVIADLVAEIQSLRKRLATLEAQ